MKLLIVTQYYWPEVVFIVINQLSQKLVEDGHSVTVVTGKPNYPEGVIFDGYSSKGIHKEWYGGVEVLRLPLRPRGKSRISLFLNYLSFVLSGIFYLPGLVGKRKFDAVLVYAPSPITSAIPAIFLNFLCKRHLAVWIQDLWPESLSAMGFIKNRVLLKMVGWLVRGIYFFSDTLLIPSRAFQAPVANYAHSDKIIYYPNSYEGGSQIPDRETKIPVKLLEELEQNFCMIYTGNLGIAQSVEIFIEVTKILKHLPDFKLILVGSGSRLKWLEEQKAINRLDNLILAGHFQASEMPQFFSRAAGLLVTLKKDEVFSFTIPGKVQAYLAAGKPVVAALDGEGARIIEEAQAGLVCSAEDAEGFAKCIEKVYNMSKEARGKLGENGRKYYLEHFEVGQQGKRLVEILEQRIRFDEGVKI